MIKLSKKALALICTLSLSIGLFACVITNNVSAEDTTDTTSSYAKWDFNDNTLGGITTTLSTDDAATDYYLKNTAGYLNATTSQGKTFLIVFNDFTLEANTKYIISYKFMTNHAEASIRPQSYVGAAAADTSSSVKLISLHPSANEWAKGFQLGWQKNSVIFDTADSVDNTNNKLAFSIMKGNGNSFLLDDVEIKKLEGDSLNIDFEDDTSGGVINSNYSSPMSVEDSGDSTANKALKLTKGASEYYIYNLMLPYELSAGDYVLTYRYKTTLENSGTNGGTDGIYLTKPSLFSSPNSSYQNFSYGNSVAAGTSLGYTKLGAVTETDGKYEAKTTGWVDVVREITITDDNIEAGLSCLTLEYALWKNIGSTTGADTPEAYIYIDDITIENIVPDTYKAFTFDDGDTTYGSVVHDNTANTATVTDGALAITYADGSKTLVTLDYTLKSNTKYFITYKFKTLDWRSVVNNNSTVACAEKDNMSNMVELGKFHTFDSEWQAGLHGTNTRAMVLDTGTAAVYANRCKLAFYLIYGDAGTIYLDNIIIYELNTADEYSADFEDGTLGGVMNYTTNAVSVEGGALKLEKTANAAASYKLLLPVELVARNTYSVSYKYKTNAGSGVTLGSSTAFYYVNENSCDYGLNDSADNLAKDDNLAKSFNGFAGAELGTAPTIASGDWATDSFTFTPSADDIANGYKYINLTVNISSSLAAYNIYLDDISVEIYTSPVTTGDYAGVFAGSNAGKGNTDIEYKENSAVYEMNGIEYTAFRVYGEYQCPVVDGVADPSKIMVDGEAKELVSRTLYLGNPADGDVIEKPEYTSSTTNLKNVWDCTPNDDGKTATVTYSFLLRDIIVDWKDYAYAVNTSVTYKDGDEEITVNGVQLGGENMTPQKMYESANAQSSLAWFTEAPTE